MSLVKEYDKLNKLADEVVKDIGVINEKYLNEDIEYPHGDVSKLMDRYDVMLGKVLRKRYSLISIFLSKINSKRRDTVRSLESLNKHEILNTASNNTIMQLLELFSDKKLYDEDNRKILNDKIFPIVKNMNLSGVVSLYKKIKEKTYDENALRNLQEMFVEYIISNILHDPVKGRTRGAVVWTYEEICKNILNEESLKLIDK